MRSNSGLESHTAMAVAIVQTNIRSFASAGTSAAVAIATVASCFGGTSPGNEKWAF